MRYLRFIFHTLIYLITTILYKWIFSGIDIVKRFCKTFKAYCEFKKLPHPTRDEGDPCHKIDNPAFHRPDPCIYSQPYLLKLGLPVTYDNPDITVMKNGVIVDENDLLPNTDYEINATIWNNSYEAPVVGLNVHFSFLSFGASTVDNPIGTAIINLGVKGGPNHPALAKMIWTTPPAPGHFCLQVLLNWVDDANPENNLGQNNVNVVTPHSPATSSFKLRNNTKKENRYRFETDTYSLPALKTCEPKKTSGQPILLSKRLPQILAIHNKANFPVPAGVVGRNGPFHRFFIT
jgi:hypothetical protein